MEKKMSRELPYISAQKSVYLKDLSASEYYGEDFAARKNSVALFQKSNGAYVLVWTHGNWGELGLARGDYVSFRQTQTFARTEARLICSFHTQPSEEALKFLIAETSHKVGFKLTEWTLK
jgi:hypothetical protein